MGDEEHATDQRVVWIIWLWYMIDWEMIRLVSTSNILRSDSNQEEYAVKYCGFRPDPRGCNPDPFTLSPLPDGARASRGA